jgi:hypothetical protein
MYVECVRDDRSNVACGAARAQLGVVIERKLWHQPALFGCRV